MLAKNCVLALASAVVAFCSSDSLNAAQPIPQYQVLDLGRVSITGGGAKDINESGQVALNLDGIAHVYYNGNLSPPGGVFNNNTSFAINSKGHLTWTQNLNAAYWDGNVVRILPGTFDGWDINSFDHIVGTAQDGHAFVWDGTTVNTLPKLLPSGGPFGGPEQALGINDSDVVVGQSSDMPVQWVNGSAHSLPLPNGFVRGTASNINENGDIVGWVANSTFQTTHAVSWSGSGVVDLGALNGRGFTRAYGINEVGQIIGEAKFADGLDSRAFLYDRGTMTDLTSLTGRTDWVLEQAFSINTAGYIVGVGQLNGNETAFLLIPVPEPSCVTLLTACVINCFNSRLKPRRS